MADSKKPEVTHRQLVQQAAQWLRGNGYYLVACEVVTRCPEVPDAIGWKAGKWSTLIECKVSREDFRRDATKPSRKDPLKRVGQKRYYLTPPDLIKREELPEGWGLLEYVDRHVLVRKLAKAESFNHVAASNEVLILTSLLRRAEIRGVQLFETLSERLKAEGRGRRKKKINLGDD
jgi:hypothetical protein